MNSTFKKYWWLLPICLLAAGVVVILYNPTPTSAVFDFNDGTTQGWTYNGHIYDDAGVNYGGKIFNPGMLKNIQKTLTFFPDQLGLYLTDPTFALGFPLTSSYWRIDITSPNLGPAWKGLKGIKVSIKDQLGMVDNVLELKVFVRYSVNGSIMEVPAKTGFNPKLPHNNLTIVSENINLPSSASPLNIILRIRGKWKDPNSPVIQLYEGQVYIDDISKIL
jgi:hypothetical protein